ncbi:MAG: hypothetical protein R6U98_08985 [Pirellulaceae bacterium]
MRPRALEASPHDQVFRSLSENPISPRHLPVRLDDRFDSHGLDDRLGAYCETAEVGQPPKRTGLMSRLVCVKHTFCASYETLVERWIGNSSWRVSRTSTHVSVGLC